ncbi:hypothetical protein ACFSS8_03790 [Paracoccus kondratievae]
MDEPEIWIWSRAAAAVAEAAITASADTVSFADFIGSLLTFHLAGFGLRVL